ncbi:PPC domain-containing protein, partial [Singulisphaera rosea]
MHGLRIVFLIGLLGVGSSVRANPPRLTGNSPLGVRRGEMTVVTFQGAGLGEHPRLHAPFAFRVEESGNSGGDGTRWKVRLAVEDGTAVGVYPVHVVTDSGISNPILLAVGQVGQVAEVEPNNAPGNAQVIANPAIVEGECPGNDRDFFRFEAKRGQRVVVDALGARIGSEVDPMVRLTTADGRLVASADDTPGLLTDAYLAAVLPEDGAYLVEFCDSRFAGAGRTAYRLTIGAVPFAGEVHPFVAPRGQNTAFELRGGTLSVGCLFAMRTPSDPRLATFHPAIPARSIGDPAWAGSDLDVEFPAPIPLGSPFAVLESADPGQRL